MEKFTDDKIRMLQHYDQIGSENNREATSNVAKDQDFMLQWQDQQFNTDPKALIGLWDIDSMIN